MSKTKITLAAIGGVSLVAILGAMIFAYLAFDAQSTGEEDLESLVDVVRAKQHTEIKVADGKLKLPTCDASKEALDGQCEQMKIWREEAYRLAARGDTPIKPMSVAQFKEFIISEAHRMESLPVNSTNKIVEADFGFGPFKPYISEGKMPEQSELKDLQRKFDDVVRIIEMLSESGITRVKALDLDERHAAPKASQQTETKTRGRNNKNNAQAKKPTTKEPEVFKPETHTYRVICSTTPAAFVRALNRFATCERFIVVDEFTLDLERDTIAAELSGDGKKEEFGSSRRNRGARAVEVEEQTNEEGAAVPKVTPVTDPMTDSSFEAILTISVHDFKSLEETADKPEEEVK